MFRGFEAAHVNSDFRQDSGSGGLVNSRYVVQLLQLPLVLFQFFLQLLLYLAKVLIVLIQPPLCLII